jgi:hypothetical protein
MDISRIEPKFIKENQLVGLGFPRQGYVFARINGIEDVYYDNYTESPGSVAADTYEDSSRLPISEFSLDNLLRVEQCDHLYQVFMDIIRDSDLVDRILKGSQPCRLVSIGGIGGSMDYNAKGLLDVGFIRLGATRAEIETAVAA